MSRKFWGKQHSNTVSSESLDGDTLTTEIVLEIVDQLQLLLDREAAHDCLEYRADGDVMFANKAAVVDVGKDAHQELAIHSVCHTTMSRNTVSKVLNIKGALET